MATDPRLRRTRTLRELCEPVSSLVYFVDEVREEYAALGLAQFGDGYFVSRAACLGRAPGWLVASSFGVFNPAVVVPLTEQGWSRTTPDAVLAARYRGATAALRRVAGEVAGAQRAVQILRPALESITPAGRPLFAGLRSLPFPDDPVGGMWRACDMVRERRGDAHIACWVSAGCDAVEIGLLTELYWRMPMGTYIRTRSWSEADVAAGVARLEAAGHVAGGAFTDRGRAFRAGIEDATDRCEADLVDAIGGDFDELVSILEPVARGVLDAGAYPGGTRSLDDLLQQRR